MAILINDNTARQQYVATAGQDTFSVPFEFFENADLVVYNGSTLLTYDASPADATEYSVIGAGVTGGGSITLGGSGAEAGDIITVIRDIAVKRVTDFPLSGPFNIDALNLDLDRLTAMIQEIETDNVGRVLHLQDSDTPNTINALPLNADRAEKYFWWDEDGQPSFKNLTTDDIPILNQDTTGSAGSLATGRTISLTGDVTYTSGAFNGTANVTGTATLASSGVTAGTYTFASITVDGKGRVTSASSGSPATAGANTNITSLTGITGAISTVDSIAFDTGAGVSVSPAQIAWNADDGCLDIGMGYDSVVQQVGLETYFRIKADSTITNGQCIMATGAVGASGVITGAPATGLTEGQYVIGVATMDIASGSFGYVTNFGLVRGINTTGSAVGETWADGDILYYNPSVTGGLTNVMPVAPNPKVTVALVVNAGSGGSGSLFIRVNDRPKIMELQDVYAPSPIANGQLLIGDGAQSRWESATLTAGTGIGITNAGGSITVTNSSPDQTVTLTEGANVTITGTYPDFTIAASVDGGGGGTGTVTSVAATVPTGFSISGSPITTSGTLAISYSAGYSLPTDASQSNWNSVYSSWGSKTAPSGTVVGTSDSQTLTNKTLTGFVETVYAISGTTPAISAANGTIQTWTLSGNSTPTDSLSDGQSITLMIDDGSSYTITWTSLVDQWIGGSAPTLATSGYSVVEIWKVGSSVYGAYVGDAS